MDPVGILGLVVGVTGLVFGIYQNRSKRQIRRLSLLNAWTQYKTASAALGFLDKYYKHSDPLPPQTSDGGSAIAKMSELHKLTIRNLLHQYDDVSGRLIEQWMKEGRITEGQAYFLKENMFD